MPTRRDLLKLVPFAGAGAAATGSLPNDGSYSGGGGGGTANGPLYGEGVYGEGYYGGVAP